MPEGKMTKKWNYATDLAINSELTVFAHDRDAPTGYVVESSLLPLDKALIPTVGPFAEMAPHLSAEEYMTLLPDNGEEPDQGSPGGQGDGEPTDGEGEGQGVGEGQGDGEGQVDGEGLGK